MRTIHFLDTTLRDGEQSPGCSMHIDEKLELALMLEKLGVDVIEAGFPVSSDGDRCAVRKICDTLKNCSVTALSRAREMDIMRTYEAIQTAVNPRLHLVLATSPIHLQYKLRMTEQQVLELIESSVRFAAGYLSNVQFSAEDATRTPLPFLAKAYSTAIRAGATVINVPDTVGYATPAEMSAIIEYLFKNVEGIEKTEVSVHCHNDLGMAVANTLAAVKAGVTQVEATINGIGERSGNASLEEIAMALKTRRDLFDCESNIETNRIYKTSKLLSNIIGVQIPPNKPIVGANAFAHESGIHQHGVLANKLTYEIMTPDSIGIPENVIVLGKHSGKHAFSQHLKELGYSFTQAEIEHYFELFKAVADKKKYVTERDLESLISHNTSDTIKMYRLESYDLQATDSGAEAEVALYCGNTLITARSDGNGSVDATFKAINAIVGANVELTDYSLHAVTEGEDALGEAVVKLKLGEDTATGRGLSVDILRASILAYVDGINKLPDYQLKDGANKIANDKKAVD